MTGREEKITLPAREVPVLYEVDALVAGGGLAGVCAAVAAAETGASVILLESGGCLGGIATAGLLSTLGGYYLYDGENYVQIVKGLADRILTRLYREGSAGEAVIYKKTANVPYDVPMLERILDQLVLAAGVKVLFHQRVSAVLTEESGESGPDGKTEKQVSRVVASGKQGDFALRCRTLIDCTGDGDAAFYAGAEILKEPGYCQYPSALFHLSDVNMEQATRISRESLTEISRRAVERGLYDLPRIDGGIVPLPRAGEARCNLTRLRYEGRPANPFDREEMSWGEIEGRRQAYLYLDFLRNQVPGYETAKVARLPEYVGVRESRRIKGRYVLSEEEVNRGAKFADGILCCAWPVELHAGGSQTRWGELADGDYYQVPLGCLLAKGFTNLYLAGRCISATRGAQAAARICASSMAAGQAAGTAAAMAVKRGWTTAEIDTAAVRAALRAAGACLEYPWD